MRRAQRTSAAPRARGATIPAPITGWNARDAWDLMQPTDAVELVNIFPASNYCELRSGYEEHVTGIASDVRTLLEHSSGTANKLFGFANSACYDVTTAGAVGSAEFSSLNSVYWHGVNFGTSGGNFLWCCSEGTDQPRHYNGSTWAIPSISGITDTEIVGVTAHNRRLFFVMKDSLEFAYLPVVSIAGAALTFDIAPLCTLGGKLVAIGTWSRDGGSGADDLACFVTSMGEVVVYAGTDPAAAADWSLVGVFRLAPPLGRNCVQKYGGDLIIITEDGYAHMSKIMPSDRAQPQIAFSDKIDGAVEARARSYKDQSGWQVALYPRGGYGMVNVPVSTSDTYEQHVWNLATGAWCRFTGQHARCWATLDGDLYFGGATAVYKADSGLNDDGEDIIGYGKTAFNYLNARGVLKRFNLVRPVFSADGTVPIEVGIDVDFADNPGIYTPSDVTAAGATWDEATWDSDSWASVVAPTFEWRTVYGVGYCASLRVKFGVSAQSVRWHSAEIMYEMGAGI